MNSVVSPYHKYLLKVLIHVSLSGPTYNTSSVYPRTWAICANTRVLVSRYYQSFLQLIKGMDPYRSVDPFEAESPISDSAFLFIEILPPCKENPLSAALIDLIP